jgi:hypothetical protein
MQKFAGFVVKQCLNLCIEPIITGRELKKAAD